MSPEVAASTTDPSGIQPPSRERKFREIAFKYGILGCLSIGLIVLAVILYDVAIRQDGFSTLFQTGFFTENASSVARDSGIYPALIGTLWLMAVCILFIVPIGVATAVYLEEYADRDALVQPLHRAEHPEPRRRALDHLRHPRPRVPRARPALARPRGACRRASPWGCSCSLS